ncbi:MAG: hypothetical protein JEY96_02760 [Bacteroidales bacterium]|nr:hypothetical protein [Bacteroidales bacterium]
MKNFKLKQWLFLALSFTILFSSCSDDDDNNDEEVITGDYIDGAFITNEGAFGAGNGSVSFYSYEGDSVINDVFQTVNNRVLGDVVQSLTVFNHTAYMVVNGSNKVEVAKSNTFEELGVISDVTNPRYFIAINKDKGYVSQWGDNGAIKVVDLNTLAVTKTIETSAGSERMIMSNGYVYVANSGGYANNNTISVIDPAIDEVTATITLDGDSPRDLVIDANNDIWVLCAGFVTYNADWSVASQTASKLIRINPTTNEVAETITIAEDFHPTCLETSKNGNNLFYGGGAFGVYKMSINDDSAPTEMLINKYFYGFDINPETGIIYAMEASFTSNSTMLRYETNGTLIKSYIAGIGSNGANFQKK